LRASLLLRRVRPANPILDDAGVSRYRAQIAGAA
jgi:hypothetical protein